MFKTHKRERMKISNERVEVAMKNEKRNERKKNKRRKKERHKIRE